MIRTGAWVQAALSAVLPVLALSACSFDLGPSSDRGPASSPAVERSAISAHERILQSHGGVYADVELAKYVDGVIDRLAQHGDLSTRTYQLTILNSPLANAMALSDGRVYVTRGMLAHLNNEAELAAVLAHEMAHVSAGHIASRRSVASDIALLDSLVDSLVDGLVGLEGRAGLLSRTGLLAGYSRLQENDADRLAVGYLDEAGYDPLAVSNVLTAMNAYTKHRASQMDTALWADPAGWVANHPDTQDRARRTAELAHALRLSAQPKQQARGRYMATIDGLLFGMQDEQGFVRGHRFLNIVEGVRFQVPESFQLFNTGDVVWALGPDKVIVKYDHLPIDGEADALTYLTTDWAGSLALRDVRQFNVSGLPGASAWMRFQGLNTLAAVIVTRPGRAHRFLIGVPPQVGERHAEDIHGIIDSFGLIDGRDAQVGPLKISVMEVSFAAQMGDVAQQLQLDAAQSEMFYLINGSKADDPVAPGFLIKRIEEVSRR
ncbi:MAG: M48 family metalloprotease [Rhodobiaceae bacterium]|nr:M48 family metalloprotease [Rhodobiaceae bacterium]